MCLPRASQVALAVKNPPAKAGDLRDSGSIPGSGRFPGGRQGNPLQYSCLENPMDRGALQATVHGVTESWTQLKQLSTAHTVIYPYLLPHTKIHYLGTNTRLPIYAMTFTSAFHWII